MHIVYRGGVCKDTKQEGQKKLRWVLKEGTGTGMRTSNEVCMVEGKGIYLRYETLLEKKDDIDKDGREANSNKRTVCK